MGKIQFYGATSLDGYLATTDNNIDWLTGLNGIPADVGAQTLSQMTSAIMGRVTYDYVAQFAPNAPFNPQNPQMHSYVMTHATREDTPQVTFTAGSVTELASHLRLNPGNVWVVGGQQILTPLLEADLIDELYLQVAPIVLGQGKRLFGDLTTTHKFELTAVHQYGPLSEMVFRQGN
ncbi:dihydrofolate reductase family protein [Levilactobacillus tongjiangensis]|uniref:Dihydrofolate reductase family protein n=1 Tax=Levilactobacillus tongjiangensis TaxID=2486023 RepID=A0ABW1SNR2_9LACO|nr:dihydrofolate reductase family protein [Levilactobacillus tongjiangensis]